jgi:hypothetical protein
LQSLRGRGGTAYGRADLRPGIGAAKGYNAHALGEATITEAGSVTELDVNFRDAVRCHFGAGAVPRVIRLHFGEEGVIGL